MQVVKAINTEGKRIELTVQAMFTPGELRSLRHHGLLNYRIQTRDGPFVGKHAISVNMMSAFRVQFGKVKNRWSTALVRTTGFTLVDLICFSFSLIFNLLRGIARLVFGRRRRLSTAIDGIKIRSKRPERIKEAEFFILVSLAAVAKALEYVATFDQEHVYDRDGLLLELAGLDFAGAGSVNESELDSLTTLTDSAKVHA